MTDREQLLLWLLMKHDIYRYLMVNSVGREDGAEKSTRHINLVKTMMSFINCVEPYDAMIIEDLFDGIHCATKELTDNLDKMGLPLDRTTPDYDALANRFFDEFVRLSYEVAKDEGWL